MQDCDNTAIDAFLEAAEALCAAGETAQAELRYRQALRQAQLSASCDEIRRVSEVFAQFYRLNARLEEARELENAVINPEPPKRMLDSKFVKRRTTTDSLNAPTTLPAEIRKACQILGLSTEQEPSVAEVNKAWKQSIVEAAGHPDLGGEADLSVLLNTSKDQLVQWLNSKLQIGKVVAATPIAMR
jgi:hypothetical protein